MYVRRGVRSSIYMCIHICMCMFVSVVCIRLFEEECVVLYICVQISVYAYLCMLFVYVCSRHVCICMFEEECVVLYICI